MRLEVYLLPVVWLAVYLFPDDAAGSVSFDIVLLAVYLLPADAAGSVPIAS